MYAAQSVQLNGHFNEDKGWNLYTIVINSVIVNKTLRARTHRKQDVHC